MRDLDLNIFPIYYEKKSTFAAILSLINNNYVGTVPYNNDNFVNIEYEPTNQILKLNLLGWSIRPECFINQEADEDEFPFTLLNATAILTAQGKQLSFKSKFGTFIPYLKQKEGINTPMPTLYLKDEDNSQVKEYTNLKDLFNHDETTTIGTTISIAPVSLAMLNQIKKHLSWCQNWKEVIATTNGYLLIANDKMQNAIYLDGINLDDEINNEKPLFLYSYDLNDNLLTNKDNDDILDQVINNICLILSALSDEDKKRIYPTLFNNENAKEWTFSKIQILLTKYFNELNPNKYVILVNDDQPFPDYVELVNQANKTIVKVNKDAYYTLMDEGIASIYSCANQLIKENYENAIINADLVFSEQSNLNLLIEFIDYFEEHYEPFKQLLAKDELPYLRWGVVAHYPFDAGTYSWRLQGCIIAQSNLTNLATLFNTACDIVWRYSTKWVYKDFRDAWLKCTIDFLATYRLQKQDWQPKLSSKELKNLNKKLS